MDRFLLSVSLFLSLSFFTGCATVSYPPLPLKPKIPGIYHQVRKGETLWRISQVYRTPIESIVKANRLSDADRIERGQLLFIPYARKALDTKLMEEKEEGFIWPLKNKVILFYGAKKDNIREKGINIKGREGEKIVAARSGKVSFCSDYVKGYGKLIIIDHDQNFQTVYAHNSKNLVSVGQEVKQGSVIAEVGCSGRVSTPQLHFEIRENSRPKNPLHYLP